MKYFIITLFLISCSTTKQSTVIVNDATYQPVSVCFSANDEKFTSSWKLQRSKNNRTWETIATYTPLNSRDSSVYCFQLPRSSVAYYYQVLQFCVNNTWKKYITYIKTTLK